MYSICIQNVSDNQPISISIKYDHLGTYYNLCIYIYEQRKVKAANHCSYLTATAARSGSPLLQHGKILLWRAWGLEARHWPEWNTLNEHCDRNTKVAFKINWKHSTWFETGNSWKMMHTLSLYNFHNSRGRSFHLVLVDEGVLNILFLADAVGVMNPGALSGSALVEFRKLPLLNLKKIIQR